MGGCTESHSAKLEWKQGTKSASYHNYSLKKEKKVTTTTITGNEIWVKQAILAVRKYLAKEKNCEHIPFSKATMSSILQRSK
uniref:Ser1 n=1 Tax=Arundo donax TaxID=35708 RepID=A0A0A9AMU1_ARUDO